MSAAEAVTDRSSVDPLIRSSVWLGNSDVQGIVGAIDAPGMATSVAEASGGSVKLTCEVLSVAGLDYLGAMTDQLPSFDLAFVSAELGSESGSCAAASDAESDPLLASVQTLRATGAHVFVILPSTLLSPSAAPGARQPQALALHARNIAGIHAASKSGASVIDLDRLVAEIGGDLAVAGPGQYTDRLLDAARSEVIRILSHYRLLDRQARPVDQPILGEEQP